MPDSRRGALGGAGSAGTSQAAPAGPLATLIGNLEAAGAAVGGAAGAAEGAPGRAEAVAFTGEIPSPAAARFGGEAAGLQEAPAIQAPLETAAALPAGIFGTMNLPADWPIAPPAERPGPPLAETAQVPALSGPTPGGPGGGEPLIGDDPARPAGKDQRRRQEERELVHAVQRRLLEERERMGGLGGLIR